MADISQFVQSFQGFRSTFKETSFDSEKNENLCTDESQQVINFDKIIETIYPDSNVRPKSFDALYVHGDNIFCIEFKNQKPSQINNKDIREKLEEGKNELDTLLGELNIPASNYTFTYCVAYQKCAEPYDRYKCGIDKGRILFGLEQYKNQRFVKEIFTENVDFFSKQFKKQLKRELSC